MSELNSIALKILQKGRGILAADESTGTMTKSWKQFMLRQHQKIDCYLEKLYLVHQA